MKVRFHPLARRELIAAALYLDKEAHLGADFLDEYEKWESELKVCPEFCPEIGMGIRKGILKRFKYLVGYKIKGTGRQNHVRILYIRHFSQNRKDWDSRT
jgi:hypothetical protein